jgi:putative protease
MTPVRPELLAPAGDWECARAAVENGADAIYFGLERFNARMRAKNFTQADLPALMEFLHRRGVRGYVTFNTLVFADELADAETYLRGIIAAGVDAAIVQDVGICRLIRALSPDFPIHASTQMTVTSAAGVRFARRLGANLVVLARENSIADIAAIQGAQGRGPGQVAGSPGTSVPAAGEAPTVPASAPPLPLEVFVHGALCVAYSGQCLTSESLGGRSANRGECAQACRLPYELVADGQTVDLGDRRYLLSPQDLSGVEVLPDLLRVGVASLKIEGRLKSPEYVASITRVYREALDRAMAAATGSAAGGAPAGSFDRTAARYELEMSFSRGLHTGWFRGIDNQALAHARFGTKRGVYLGEVAAVRNEAVSIRLVAPLKPGDGIVFDAGQPDLREEGGRVYQVEAEAGSRELTRLRFGQGDIDWSRVQAGQKVWKTNDPALDRAVRATFAGDQIRFRQPIAIEVHGRAGSVLTVIARDGQGHEVSVDSTRPLAVAENQPLTQARLAESLGRLGGTPFQLGELRSHLEGSIILPVSELNRLRRETTQALEALRARPHRWQVREQALRLDSPHSEPVGAADVAGIAGTPATGAADADQARSLLAAFPWAAGSPSDSDRLGFREGRAELIAVIRLPEQLEAAWSAGARTLYCEFENPKHYREAVARFRELEAGARAADAGGDGGHGSVSGGRSGDLSGGIWLAPPRVFKPGEEWILRQVRSANADGYLVRNYDHLEFFAGDRRRGDFSLNVANPWAASHFIHGCGLERVTASYDLNAAQLEALLRSAPPGWFDLTIHQHMPMFHMEHCVFCAFLSTGHDYRDCGRPCDRHRVALRDRVGAELPLKADAGCRNTVYNNRAQSGAEFVSRLRELGARSFRVEFVNEGAAEVTRTVGRYRQLLDGAISGSDLWQELKLINQLGVTRGQMEATPQVIQRKS